MSEVRRIVTYYGLHTSDEGVRYLCQGRRQAANFIGLNKPSPFEVLSDKGRRACPHLINPSVPIPDKVQWSFFMDLYQDPLVKHFLPVPRRLHEPIPYLNDPGGAMTMHLVLLSRLSSPIYPVVHPLKGITNARIRDELSLTNLAPLVLVGFETSDQERLQELALEAPRAPRRLILAGDPLLVIRSPFQRVSTYIQDYDPIALNSAPMESLGSVALRRYARNEQIDAPWARRDD